MYVGGGCGQQGVGQKVKSLSKKNTLAKYLRSQPSGIYSPPERLSMIFKICVFFILYLKNLKCMQPYYGKICLSPYTLHKTTHQNFIILLVLRCILFIISYQLQRELNIKFNIPSILFKSSSRISWIEVFILTVEVLLCCHIRNYSIYI